MKTRYFLILLALTACSSSPSRLSREEKSIISDQDSLMHVLTINDASELEVLRAKSIDFAPEDLAGEEFKALVAKMKYTVQDPSQDGVGIAAPQVGLNRRLIVVCRLDKPGEPFEAYANVQIDSLFGPLQRGREGCLSIPDKYGEVERSRFAIVSYIDPDTLKEKKDTVSDYVARIFQHECDHLSGVLYTDRL